MPRTGLSRRIEAVLRAVVHLVQKRRTIARDGAGVAERALLALDVERGRDAAWVVTEHSARGDADLGRGRARVAQGVAVADVACLVGGRGGGFARSRTTLCRPARKHDFAELIAHLPRPTAFVTERCQGRGEHVVAVDFGRVELTCHDHVAERGDVGTRGRERRTQHEGRHIVLVVVGTQRHHVGLHGVVARSTRDTA